MAADGYIAGPFDTDVDALLQRARDTLADRYPTVELAPGSLLEWAVETDAQTGADIGQLALTVAEDVTRSVLGRLLNEPQGQATPAGGTITVQVTGQYAITIDAGTVLEGTGPDGEPVSVETVTSTPVAQGVTSVTGIDVQTLQLGTVANGTDGELLGLDQFPWGLSASIEAPLAGAEDEEDPDVYLNRLVRLARIYGPRPINATDVAEYVVLKVRGIAAALCLENTNPGPPVVSNLAGHFAVGVRADDGTAPPSSQVMAAQAVLTAALTSTIVAHVVTANYTTVGITATVYAWPGYDKTVIKSECEAALAAYVSPATWGRPPQLGDAASPGSAQWFQQTGVFVAEAIARLDSASTGVDRVDRASVQINGSNNDLTLSGLFPLPLPGTMTVTVLDR